jgi:hypothetical protein
MIFRNLIFQAEVVEQRFGAVVLPHHDQQACENSDPQHGKHFSFFLPCFCRHFYIRKREMRATPSLILLMA